MDILPSTEMWIRLGCFVGIFLGAALLETAFPCRTRKVSRVQRWSNNLGISAINQLATRLLIPTTTIGLALICEQHGLGLLNLIAFSAWIEIPLAILLLDLAIYLQHRAYHVIPFLWRFHRMHHADTEFDVSTGIRFHPASVLLSAFIKLGVILLIGPAAIAVLIFEIVLNATSMFNHSNLAMPHAIDRMLRLLVVTPDMHRVHHSSDENELKYNFGFNFPWWDRLFHTYLAQAALGHKGMEIGLSQFRGATERRVDRMLSQPFRKQSPPDH